MNNHSLSLALLCAALALTACKGGAQGGQAAAQDKQLTEAEAKAYMEALPESRALTIDGWRWVDPTVLEADLERVPAHENSAEDDRVIEAFITDMFMSGRYTDEAFLEEHCTPRLLQQLRDDYDYEGEGYANWDFRSLANDGLAELDAIRRIDKKDGRYYYEGNDGGTLFRNILSAFVQDGKVMMDGIVRDRTYYAVPE